MTKSELVKKISAKYEYLDEKEVQMIVDKVFEEIADAMKEEKRVEIRGFGVFATKFRKASKGLDPRNSQPIELPSRKVPFFKMGKELKEIIN